MAEFINHHESLSDLAERCARADECELVGSWIALHANVHALNELKTRGVTSENVDQLLREIGVGMGAVMAAAELRELELPELLVAKPIPGA